MKESVKKQAYEYAEWAHRQQLDDSGQNYFKAHCKTVAQLLNKLGCDDEVVAAGYLHDTVEDTQVTERDLRVLFGDRIADLVMEVTHEGTKDNYGYWFPRLETKDGIIIKLADRMSNLSRMTPWPENRRAQYLRKTKFWRSEGPTCE